MKKAKFASLILIISALILEVLPYGAVCNFMGDPEAHITVRYTFSYFDLTPFGYANFGPFLTAVLSCILLLLIAVSFFTKVNIVKPIIIISAIAVITSLMPLLYGFNYYSAIGLFITLVLATTTAVHLKINNYTRK